MVDFPHPYGFSDLPQAKLIRDFLRRLESLCVFFLLFHFSGAVLALFFTDPTILGYEAPLIRALWYPSYFLILILSLKNLPRIMRLVAFNPLLVLCVLWCAVSVSWSILPDISFRRAIALLITTLFGFFLAAQYDWNGLIQRIAVIFLFLAIISLGIVIVVPEYGIMPEVHVGAWRGAWTEKNSMGGTMSKGVIVCLCAFAMQPKRGWLWVSGAILCFGLVIMSTSKTALLIALFGILGFIVIRIYRRFPIFRLPLFYTGLMVVAVFIALMLSIPDDMLALIGKERTLTGRTDIWTGLIESIRNRPLLGYGYAVYWWDPIGPSYYVRLVLEWGIPSAHNGWIETWLSAGFIAVIMFSILFLMTLWLAISRLKKGGTEAYWVILSMIMFLMFSMSESTILQQNDLSWVLFVATCAKLFAFERPYFRNRKSEPYFGRHI